MSGQEFVDVRGNPDLSRRIDYLRLFSIVMVVVYHMGPVLEFDFAQTSPILQNETAVMLTYVTRELVPAGALSLLPAITGLLVFAKPTQRPYFVNVRKWSKSLLLPYFVWGLVGVAALYILHFCGVMNNYSGEFIDLSFYNFFNASLGLDTYPFNYPVYFMRNMFLLLLFYPAIDWISRNLGFAPIVLIVALSVLGTPLPLFYDSWAIPLGLFIGAYVAKRSYVLGFCDKWGHWGLVLWMGLGMLQAYNLSTLQNQTIVEWNKELDTIMSLSAMIGAWWVSKYFTGTSLNRVFKKLFPYSFPIFCIHALCLRLEYRIFDITIGYGQDTFILHQLIAVPIVVLMCVIIAMTGERLAPNLWAFVMGQRSRSFIDQGRKAAASATS